MAEASSTNRAAQPSTAATTAGPTAEYMQARIEVLTKQLIRRYGDILDTALDPSTDNNAASIVDTANRQLIVDTSTAALIRAAEELMVLTRTMKELWLFGGLDTLQKDESEQEKEARRQIEEDERIVVRGMREWSRREVGRILNGGGGDEDGHSEGEKEDVQMHSNIGNYDDVGMDISNGDNNQLAIPKGNGEAAEQHRSEASGINVDDDDKNGNDVSMDTKIGGDQCLSASDPNGPVEMDETATNPFDEMIWKWSESAQY